MEHIQQRGLSKMVTTSIKAMHTWTMVLSLMLFSLLVSPACAIDNPDAPDYTGAFETRELVFLNAVNKPDNGSRATLIAYDDYLKFLDDELNQAYQLLMSKLPAERQLELKQSQQNWIKFRDAEFELIQNTWTRKNFGSSANMSRGAYRSSIVKNRVLELISYARNF